MLFKAVRDLDFSLYIALIEDAHVNLTFFAAGAGASLPAKAISLTIKHEPVSFDLGAHTNLQFS